MDDDKDKKYRFRINADGEEELVVENDLVYSKKNPQVKYTWSRIADDSQQIYKHEVFVSEEYVPDTNPGVAGVHFALVEVDTYTGMTKILDYLAVHDIGQAIIHLYNSWFEQYTGHFPWG